MLLVSLGLTVSTCLSGGCGQIAVANNVAQINESAVKIIQKSIDNFDYGNYSLTFNEQESFSKQKLLSFAEENQLFTVDVLNDLKTFIESDGNFTYFGNIDELFIRESNVDSVLINQDINQINTQLNGDLKAKSTIDNIAIDKRLVVNKNFSDISFTVDNSGGTSGENKPDSSKNDEAKDIPDITPGEEIYKLPTVPCDANNLSTSVNGQVDGVNFFGILCSKDACINLYNTFANWINKQAMYKSGNNITPFKIISEGFKALLPIVSTTILGAAVITKINGIIATIARAASSIWANFCSLFTAGGPVGIIIGLVIGLLGAACIGTLIAMIVYGYLSKGFAIGWKMHSICVWNWEWFCGNLD
jgi:hypothetical protein